MLHHPNARTCWPKVRFDQAEMQTVFVIETDLALLPDDPAYAHEAFSTFVEAIRAYLADHPSYIGPKLFRFEVGRRSSPNGHAPLAARHARRSRAGA